MSYPAESWATINREPVILVQEIIDDAEYRIVTFPAPRAFQLELKSTDAMGQSCWSRLAEGSHPDAVSILLRCAAVRLSKVQKP